MPIEIREIEMRLRISADDGGEPVEAHRSGNSVCVASHSPSERATICMNGWRRHSRRPGPMRGDEGAEAGRPASMDGREPPGPASTLRLDHVVGELTLDVGFDGGQGTPALLEKIGELNRDRLIPAMEGVLDALDRPGEVFRVGRIALDLGQVSAIDLGGLEARAAEALRDVLLRERSQGQASNSNSARPAAAPVSKGDGAPGPIHVTNAGLVLLAPFLPPLFSRLKLLRRDGKLSRKGWDRAVHLLQWLVYGRTDFPEPMLALNKVICGLAPDAGVPPRIDPTQEELALCGSLLDAVIANWPAIGGTSVEALRETFLQREGRLDPAEKAWRLVVERKVLDVLLESLPWSYSNVLHPWMGKPLAVTW